MSRSIITISREPGSRGRSVGRRVAEQLGYEFYDSEIIDKIFAESHYAKDYIKKHGEEFDRGRWFLSSFTYGDTYEGCYTNMTSPQDQIWEMQCQVIQEIADKGNCVIIGRCADYLLRERKDLLKVFIGADEEMRRKYIVEKYGGDPKTIEKDLRAKDKRRASFYRFYTDQEFGNSKNYDITLNAGSLGVDACADILVQLSR